MVLKKSKRTYSEAGFFERRKCLTQGENELLDVLIDMSIDGMVKFTLEQVRDIMKLRNKFVVKVRLKKMWILGLVDYREPTERLNYYSLHFKNPYSINKREGDG